MPPPAIEDSVSKLSIVAKAVKQRQVAVATARSAPKPKVLVEGAKVWRATGAKTSAALADAQQTAATLKSASASGSSPWLMTTDHVKLRFAHADRGMILQGSAPKFVQALRASGPLEISGRTGAKVRFVPVELDASSLSKNSSAQLAQVLKQLRAQGCEVPKARPGEGLWEYLHRDQRGSVDNTIWSKDNYPVEPTIVIRNAQKLFTSDRRVTQHQMLDLATNRIPGHVARSLDARNPLFEGLELMSSRYRTVLSFEAPLTKSQAAELVAKRTDLTRRVHYLP